MRIIKEADKYLISRARLGPSKNTTIPLELDEELAFFVAAIIGDGHLKKSKLQIAIELSNERLIKYIQKICKQIFNREFDICPIKLRKGKKQSWCIYMDSKAIYNLLNKVFSIPIGKKSHIVQIPKVIKNSNKSIKSSFLIGILLTEGGKRHGPKRYGLSTASKRLWVELIELFKSLNIEIQTDKWVHKKYKKAYYGLSFRKECLSFIMGECRSGQTGQIFSDIFLKEGQA